MTIETFQREVADGISLSCRAAGEPGHPLMLFLHGFPEAAFVWDELMLHFARSEHGGFRCVAPNLRGFERSTAPIEVAAYRARLLIADVLALAATESADGRIDTLVAHDWGGAVGWAVANAHPDLLGRLVIVNSPHPGTFARELRDNPEQQSASAYMNWLAAPGSEEVLARDGYARLFGMFTMMGTDGAGWLTDEVRAQYREVWDHGLTGAVNLYRVTPLRPGSVPDLPAERLRIDVPTLVIWALDDRALLPGLLDGLDDYVPELTVRRVPDATHWIVHEQPELLATEIERFQALT